MTLPPIRTLTLGYVGTASLCVALAQSPASPPLAPSDRTVIWSTNRICPQTLWGFSGAETASPIVLARAEWTVDREMDSEPHPSADAAPPAPVAAQRPERGRARDQLRLFDREMRELSLQWSLWLPSGLPRMYSSYGWIWPAGGRAAPPPEPPETTASASLEAAILEGTLEPQADLAVIDTVPSAMNPPSSPDIRPGAGFDPPLTEEPIFVVTAVIPEPSGLALLGMGLSSWMVWRSRRARRRFPGLG